MNIICEEYSQIYSNIRYTLNGFSAARPTPGHFFYCINCIQSLFFLQLALHPATVSTASSLCCFPARPTPGHSFYCINCFQSLFYSCSLYTRPLFLLYPVSVSFQLSQHLANVSTVLTVSGLCFFLARSTPGHCFY